MNEKDVIRETRPRMEAAIDDVRRQAGHRAHGAGGGKLLDNIMVILRHADAAKSDGLSARA